MRGSLSETKFLHILDLYPIYIKQTFKAPVFSLLKNSIVDLNLFLFRVWILAQFRIRMGPFLKSRYSVITVKAPLKWCPWFLRCLCVYSPRMTVMSMRTLMPVQCFMIPMNSSIFRNYTSASRSESFWKPNPIHIVTHPNFLLLISQIFSKVNGIFSPDRSMWKLYDWQNLFRTRFLNLPLNF